PLSDSVGRQLLAKRTEGGTHFGREEPRLLPSGEVAALVDLVVVGDVRVHLFDPAAWRPENLVGEGGEADRERDGWGRLAGRGRLSLGLSALPVGAGRGGPGARQPVERDVVEDVVPGETTRGLLVDKGAGDLVVAVGVVVEYPRGQGDG